MDLITDEPIDDFHVNDVVLVSTRLGGQKTSLRGSVVGVHDKELWVGLPASDDRLVGLEEGQSCSVAVARGTMALVVDTAFTRHIGARPGRLFALTRPGRLRATQQRTYARLDIAIPVDVTAIVRDQLRSGADTTVDISAGGACFTNGLGLSVGDILQMQIRISSNPVSVQAEVVRVDPPDHGLGRGTCVAVRYTKISGPDQDFITRYVYDMLQRRQKLAAKGM